MSDPTETPAEQAEHALNDADQLCAELKNQIARVREIVREAREALDPQSKPSSA